MYTHLMIIGLIVIAAATIVAKTMIPMLKGENGHKVFDQAPESHKKKSGTPSFGGFVFLIAFLVGLLVAFVILKINTTVILTILTSTLGFGAIGFIDDYIKFKKKHNDGFSFIAKFCAQVIISLIVVLLLNVNNLIDTNVQILFWKINLNIIVYFLFLVFYFSGAANATNFTDGLDGLLTSNALITTLTFMYFSFISHNMSLFSIDAIFAFSLVGFLIFNKYPAQIFMGDTGSMAIGGFLAMNAILLKIELLFVVFGFVYIFETLSVAIQMMYFKYTKKKFGEGRRIFPMTPIHHSFEKALNWKENKIVFTFCITTFVLSIIAVLLYTVGVR